MVYGKRGSRYGFLVRDSFKTYLILFTMDVKTNYLNRITELSEELNHCVEQYNLVLKKENEKKTNAVKCKEEKRKKNPPKKNNVSAYALSDTSNFT
jgi:hypothetical protein